MSMLLRQLADILSPFLAVAPLWVSFMYSE